MHFRDTNFQSSHLTDEINMANMTINVQDIKKKGWNLLQKTCYILDFHFNYRIFVSEGQNGLKCLVRLSIQKGNLSRKMAPASITFPRARLT